MITLLQNPSLQPSEREYYYRYNFYSYNDLIEVVSEYIEKYNKMRIHSYLNYKTPNSFENDYYAHSDT